MYLEKGLQTNELNSSLYELFKTMLTVTKTVFTIKYTKY